MESIERRERDDGQRPKLWKKSTLARIDREPGLGWLNPSEMECTNLHPPICGGKVPDPVGLGQNSCCLVRGSQISRTLLHATGLNGVILAFDDRINRKLVSFKTFCCKHLLQVS